MPSPTLYVNNLEQKIKKSELKKQLYALFTPYGTVYVLAVGFCIIFTYTDNHNPIHSIDIVAKKGDGARGQAFIVFNSTTCATAALRALVGESFYGRPLRIDYAAKPSNATVALEQGGQVGFVDKKHKVVTASRAEQEYHELERQRVEEEEGRGKREREGAAQDGNGEDGGDDQEASSDAKRRKLDHNHTDEQEMQLDDEEDDDKPHPITPSVLLISNISPSTSLESLKALCQTHQGFQGLSPLPPGSTPTRSVSVVYHANESTHPIDRIVEALDGVQDEGGSKLVAVLVPADAL